MIITISGTPGSGKSTVGKLVAKKLNLKHYSTGDFMREMAAERGITLAELGELAKVNDTIDKALDCRQVNLGKTEDNFVIDGRLSYHFIPNSIKIFIDADIKERARRIVQDSPNRSTEDATDIDETIASISKRKNVEQERYRKYYNLDPYEHDNYDLVIDATIPSAEEVADKIVDFVNGNN